MVGGTAQIDAGEWIYQDFVYDDYGADIGRGSSNVVTLAPTTGDFRYPTGEQYAGNAADITEVRVRPDGDSLAIRVTLNTVVDPGAPVVGLALDAGNGTEQSWPGGVGLTSTWDHFVTITGAAAQVVGSDGTADLPVTVDPAANTFEVTVPSVGAARSVTLNAAAGLWDDAAGAWMQGSPGGLIPGTFNSNGPAATRAFDLAFNSHEIEPRKGNWQEDAQAEALTLGDVTAFAQPVDLEALRVGEDRPFAFEPGHYYNGLFVSRQDIGEGMAGSFPQYQGRLQPYGLWIPTSYDPTAETTPLLVVLHSLSSHHNQYSGGDIGESYRTFYEQLPDALGAIAVTPLGRGPDGWYRNEALVDTLEALDDVDRRFAVDQDRTWLTGYSMGGYGTYRLGTLLPDRFAGAISWAGVPTDSDRLDNMMWVPTQIIHGTNDELVPISGVRAQADRYKELGHEYSFFEHPGQDHLSFVFMDHWTREVEWLEDRTRVTQPPTVSFSVQPSMWTTGTSPERRATILGHLEALDADFTSAYWVRDVAQRDTETARVEATTSAIATREPNATPYSGYSTDLAPSPYLIEGQDRSFDDVDTANALSLALHAVDAVGIDVAGAALDPLRALVLSVATDGPSTIRLIGSFPAGTTVVDSDGAAVPFSLEGDVLTVDVTTGEIELNVLPGDAAEPPRPGKGRPPIVPPGLTK